MACVNCFFESDHQKSIKKSTFGYSLRFEDKIEKYKQLFLNELSNLVPVSHCTCGHQSTNSNYNTWVDAFMNDAKAKKSSFEMIFDDLKKIYVCYVTSPKHASDELWEFVNSKNLIGRDENPLFHINLLYRARPKDPSYDPNNALELFHVPYNKRDKVGNQRFSVSGQPMLYFANSILAATMEMEKSLTDLSTAAFLPNFSIFNNFKIGEIKNYIFDTIVKSLPVIFDDGCQVSYDDSRMALNHTTAVNTIQRSIMSEIFTFPTENKGAFVEEYVLPQLFTSLLIENGFKGIVFPSTKDYSSASGQHKFAEFALNVAFFVNYSTSDLYDKPLYDAFHTFTLDGNETFLLSTTEVLTEFESIFDRSKTSATQNKNDYIVPLSLEKLRIEYMETASINGVPYYKSDEGKLELEFCKKLAAKMETLVK